MEFILDLLRPSCEALVEVGGKDVRPVAVLLGDNAKLKVSEGGEGRDGREDHGDRRGDGGLWKGGV